MRVHALVRACPFLSGLTSDMMPAIPFRLTPNPNPKAHICVADIRIAVPHQMTHTSAHHREAVTRRALFPLLAVAHHAPCILPRLLSCTCSVSVELLRVHQVRYHNPHCQRLPRNATHGMQQALDAELQLAPPYMRRAAQTVQVRPRLSYGVSHDPESAQQSKWLSMPRWQRSALRNHQGLIKRLSGSNHF